MRVEYKRTLADRIQRLLKEAKDVNKEVEYIIIETANEVEDLYDEFVICNNRFNIPSFTAIDSKASWVNSFKKSKTCPLHLFGVPIKYESRTD